MKVCTLKPKKFQNRNVVIKWVGSAFELAVFFKREIYIGKSLSVVFEPLLSTLPQFLYGGALYDGTVELIKLNFREFFFWVVNVLVRLEIRQRTFVIYFKGTLSTEEISFPLIVRILVPTFQLRLSLDVSV